MDAVIYTDDEASVGLYGNLLQETYAPYSAFAAHRFAAFRHAINKANPFKKVGTWLNILVTESGSPRAHATVVFDPRTEGVAYVGFTEMGNDASSVLLFDTIVRVAGEQGVRSLRGPIDFNTWQGFRAVSGGSDAPPFFLEPYGRDRGDRWRAHGFVPRLSYVSIAQDASRVPFAEAEADAAGVQIERVTPQTAQDAIPGLHAVAEEAFSSTWSFVPISREEFAYIYTQPLAASGGPFLILVARDSGGAVAGFLVGAADMFDPAGKTFVLKSAAVRPSVQAQGVGAAIFAAAHAHVRSHGFERYVFSTMQEHNEPVRRIVGDGALIRTYEVGEKIL